MSNPDSFQATIQEYLASGACPLEDQIRLMEMCAVPGGLDQLADGIIEIAIQQYPDELAQALERQENEAQS